MSNSTTIMSAMVDNLAEKVHKCPLNLSCCVLLAYNWDHDNWFYPKVVIWTRLDRYEWSCFPILIADKAE